jgi:RNA polymerase sigma factor (sigma-70 family)
MPDPRPETDGELLQLHERYRSALLAFFARRLHNRTEAEDLTQEVFAKLAGTSRRFREPDAYVFQTAANLLRDRNRREKVRFNYQMHELVTASPSDPLGPERVVAGRQTLYEVIDALQELPERTRTIFILHRLEKLKKGEVAALLGLSISGVDKHLVKAMVHLQGRLGETT